MWYFIFFGFGSLISSGKSVKSKYLQAANIRNKTTIGITVHSIIPILWLREKFARANFRLCPSYVNRALLFSRTKVMDNYTPLILFGVLVLLAVVFFKLYCGGKKHKESFKVLGALAQQRSLYYQCLSECERSDPAKQLSPTKGNMMCLAYCDSVITDMTRRFDPKVPVTTIDDKSYKQCGEGTWGNFCRAQASTDREIFAKCSQECEYDTSPREVCLNSCAGMYSGNKSMAGGWTWK